uniref:Nuclear pore complex protein Nup133-like n=1 Tax=Dermatophagoides pteronyssinus TaxID=6956 RepID=A0A6P6Y1R7_DERPT|nr:nuclear pore complex protein Nup133-like [Dermatophagoides pteronyssinus]
MTSKSQINISNSFYGNSTSSLMVKEFPSKLPYRIIEAFSTSNLTSKNLTARISHDGWAWFVVGRKLFIWRYLDDVVANKPKATKCYELLLPASDIAHKAELVCVSNSMTQYQQQQHSRFPSAIAVSPEGSIRYWPNIFQENNVYDTVVGADLNGQECQILLDICPLGCVLGTTTNSLAHIYIDDRTRQEPNQSPIVCRTLKVPQGLFSGIGRKFSSFIYGSLPTANYSAESRQILRIIRNKPVDDNDDVLPVFILALHNCSIQKWIIEDYDGENFCGRIDLEKHLKEAFITKFWDRTTTHHNQISIWIMDIALNRFNEIILLVMCNNSDVPNDNHFALFSLIPDLFPLDGSSLDSQNSISLIKSARYLTDICLSSNELFPQTRSTSASLSQNRPFNLITMKHSQVCYIFNSNCIYKVNLNNQDRSEKIDFESTNDFIFGATVIDQNLLLLTFKNGFLSVECRTTDLIASKQLSASDREFIQSNQTDKLSLLKRALQFFMKDDKTHAELLVHEMFPFIRSQPATELKQPTNTMELDATVCALSTDICDQIPHADPRWSTFIDAENCLDIQHPNQQQHQETHGSVIIGTQLEEKMLTHNSFIELLKRTGIWDSLTSLTNFKSIFPTKLILCEHSEKLLVCMALWKLHSHYGIILVNAIKKVLEKRKNAGMMKGFESHSHLTNQDLFYREVTKVDELFWQLIEMEETQSQIEHTYDERLIISITDIMTTVFAEVCRYRQINGVIYQTAVVADCDYVPWSSEQRITGVRDVWIKQFDLIIRCFRVDAQCHMIGDEDKWILVGQKLADLADIILDSFVCQLRYLNPANEKFATLRRAFEMTRYKCLEPLLRIKQHDRAAELAEKYEDFDILIKLCEALDNQEQLKHYSQRFAEKGFAEYLFEWYLKEGKQGKMLSSSTTANNQKLDAFLSNHDSLKWLHQLHSRRYKDASSTLKKLGLLEENCVARRKTMLSIGKLALITSGDTNYSDFDDQLRFLQYQSDLSDSLLRKNDLDRKTMPVLSPKQLVDILISGAEGPNEDLKNFQKALEIAEIIERRYSIDLHRQILFKIWQKAFEKDEWSEYCTDNLELFIKKSFFYQLAITYYGDESKKLPDIEALAENFSLVKENQKAAYFLRAAYEMIL